MHVINKKLCKKKKMETSKKMTLINYVIFVCVTVATFVAMFKGIEISSIVTFDLGVLGLITTWNGLYAWKSKNENVLKIAKAYELDEDVLKDLLLNALKENLGSGNNNF